MMRSIYTRTGCGCGMPGLTKLLDRQEFAKARKKPQLTNVGKYVSARAPGVERRLRAVLATMRAQVRVIILRHYQPPAIGKADDAAQRRRQIQALLDRLNSEDMGVDLTGALTGPMLAAFQRAAAMGLTQVGFEQDRSIVKQLDTKAREYATRRSAELVKDLADTTIDGLRGVITRGVEEGMSVDQLADAIDELGAFGEARAEMIAHTELAGAHVQGNVEGWRATGEVEKKISILGDLHDIDDQCDDCADAGAVDLEDEFAPGYDFPPYHPRCWCDVKPVLRAEE